MQTERGGKCARQCRERKNEGDRQPDRQTDREVVSLYQERAALAGSSLSVVVPLIQSAAASASEAPGWAKTQESSLSATQREAGGGGPPSVALNLQGAHSSPQLSRPSHQTV